MFGLMLKPKCSVFENRSVSFFIGFSNSSVFRYLEQNYLRFKSKKYNPRFMNLS
ncbi:hypothetical protein Hanom_Chr16g01522931 [Helianthus anomalus]